MKLLYGRAIMTTLSIRDALSYGFNTMQLENARSDDDFSDVEDDLNRADTYFNPDMDFVLSLDLQGDSRLGSNSGSGSRGSLDRDPWYDNAGSDFYAGWDAIFDSAQSGYGSRFKGLRWNHDLT